MKIVFLDAATVGGDISIAPISSLGDYVAYPATSPEEVANRAVDADILITNKVRLGAENLGGAQHLRLICVAATGYDNVVSMLRRVGSLSAMSSGIRRKVLCR